MVRVETACAEFPGRVQLAGRFAKTVFSCGTDAWPTARGQTGVSVKHSVTAGTIFSKAGPLVPGGDVTNQKHEVSALGLHASPNQTAWAWLHKVFVISWAARSGRKCGRPGNPRGATDEDQVDRRDCGGSPRAGQSEFEDVAARSLIRLSNNRGAWRDRRTDGWSEWRTKAMTTSRAFRHGDPGPHRHATSASRGRLDRWWLGIHHGAIDADHLDYYSNEFTFRFNRRRSHGLDCSAGGAARAGPLQGPSHFRKPNVGDTRAKWIPSSSNNESNFATTLPSAGNSLLYRPSFMRRLNFFTRHYLTFPIYFPPPDCGDPKGSHVIERPCRELA